MNQGFSSPHMELSQILASELEKQRVEMDCYLHFQNERLRTFLVEESKQRDVLLQRYASKMMNLIREKENDLAVATNKSMELQESLVRSDMESKLWQKKAMENEALAQYLTNKIKEARYRALLSKTGVPDADSVCDSSMSEEVKEELSKKIACKLCHERGSCVLFLPCRHLCCCISCEALLGFCPVCQSVKESGIEVFFA